MSELSDEGSWLRERQTSSGAGGTWPAKHEAADLVRRILEELPRSDADEETLRSLLEPLRTAADALSRAGAQSRGADAFAASRCARSANPQIAGCGSA